MFIRSRPEGIRCCDHDLLPRLHVGRRKLADRRRLADAVDTDNEDDERPAGRKVERVGSPSFIPGNKLTADLIAHEGRQDAGIARAFFLCPFAYRRDDCRRDIRPHIAGDKDLLHPGEKRFVNRTAGNHQARNFPHESFARARQPFLQTPYPVTKPHVPSEIHP